MSTTDKLKQLRLERQKTDLTQKLETLKAELEKSENEKTQIVEESAAKIKHALSLLDSARQEIDKLKKEKQELMEEVTTLKRHNDELKQAAKATTDSKNAAKTPGIEPNRVRKFSTGGSRLDFTMNNNKEDERPLSLKERMSLFENKSGGGRAGAGGGEGGFKSWRTAPATKINIREEEKREDPVKLRPARKSQNNPQNRHTMPPQAFTAPQQKASSGAESGKAKLGRAVAGMSMAIEAEKRQKGIEPKPAGGFLGVVNQVAPKTNVKRSQSVAAPGSAASKKAALLYWCQSMVDDKGLEIKNFSSSWNNGMAFCALFHHFIPDQIPYFTLDPKNREENFRIAFTEGEKAGVTALLDVEDMVMMKNPDWMSVMTYVSLIYNHFNGIRVGGPRLPPMPGQ